MPSIYRRSFVVKAMKVLAAVPALQLVGCTDDGETTAATEAGSSGGTADTGSTSESGTTSTGTSSTTGGTTAGDGSSSGDATTGGSGEGSTSDDGSSTGDGSTGDAACEPSPSDIEGPFYRPGIPIGGNLDVHGDNGVALVLGGQVRDDGCQPIPNAIVEIWHATPVAPDGEPGDVNALYDDTVAYRYYGQVATDAQGRFSFSTLRPGWYLNGNAYRPAHVHLKVWVGGVERLTTQLYFTGDPFNAQDAWFNPEMALSPGVGGQATIDLVVSPADCAQHSPRRAQRRPGQLDEPRNVWPVQSQKAA